MLPQILVILICSNSCLDLFRDTTEQFLNGFGLKADVWVPICRVASLAFVVVAGYCGGLTGMLLVPVLVQIILMHIWKPYYLFRDGFKMPFTEYLKILVTCTIPFVIASIIADIVTNKIVGDNLIITWGMFLFKMTIFVIPLVIISAILLWICSSGFRLFINRTLNIIKK